MCTSIIMASGTRVDVIRPLGLLILFASDLMSDDVLFLVI